MPKAKPENLLTPYSRQTMRDMFPCLAITDSYDTVTYAVNNLLQANDWNFACGEKLTVTTQMITVARLTVAQWVYLLHVGLTVLTSDEVDFTHADHDSMATLTFDLRCTNMVTDGKGGLDWRTRSVIAANVVGLKEPTLSSTIDLELKETHPTLPRFEIAKTVTLRTLGWGLSGVRTDPVRLQFSKTEDMFLAHKDIMARYFCTESPRRYLHLLPDDRIILQGSWFSTMYDPDPKSQRERPEYVDLRIQKS